MKIALFLFGHIQNPCTESRTGQNIREFYVERAREMLKTIANPHARIVLEDEIKKYSS